MNNSLLDLIFTSIVDVQCSQTTYIIREKVDVHHPPLVCVVPTDFSIKKPMIRKKLNFYNCNYDVIMRCLNSYNWSLILQGDDIDIIVDKFYNILYEIIDTHVPKIKQKNDLFPPWFNSELKRKTLEKKNAHIIYKKTQSLRDKSVFCNLRAECKRLSTLLHERYMANIERSLYSDPKFFWSYSKNLRQNNSIPEFISYDNEVSSSDSQSAEMFASFFKSVFVSSDAAVVQRNYNYTNTVHLNHLNLSLAEIYNGLLHTRETGGRGPDDVPNVFLKRCRCALAKPLFIIFNKSLALGSFPSFWKVSRVTPIFKSGEKDNALNYRPISIISAIPKLFEKLVTAQLTKALYHLIVEEQHGFCLGKSTVTNLSVISVHIAKALDEGGQIDVIYTDFAKAFDRVPHSILLGKLKASGITGSLHDWLSSYIIDRWQFVALGDTISSRYRTPSGVPQGSHLGPLMFIIFINDLKNFILKSGLLLFADDGKIYHKIKSHQDAEDLQSDLDALALWCSLNFLPLNIDKCKVLRYTNKRDPIKFDYKLDGKLITVSDKIKDLGVLFCSNGKFSEHISVTVTKALRTLGFLNRTLNKFINPFTYVRL